MSRIKNLYFSSPERAYLNHKKECITYEVNNLKSVIKKIENSSELAEIFGKDFNIKIKSLYDIYDEKNDFLAKIYHKSELPLLSQQTRDPLLSNPGLCALYTKIPQTSDYYFLNCDLEKFKMYTTEEVIALDTIM